MRIYPHNKFCKRNLEGSVVWKEREEDVCGKKEGDRERGKMEIFGVCGKK